MPKEADTTITEIVVSEAVIEAVKETVVVSEGTATVDKAAVEEITEAATEETVVVIPLAQATEETVNKAEIDTEALATVADAEKDVVIQLTDVTVKLDSQALKAVTERANGKTVEIRAVKSEKDTLNDKQHRGLEEKDVATIVTIQIFSNGEYIGDFKGGKATIKLPFQPKEGRDGKDHAVYFVDDNGNTAKVPSEYVDGHMVFTTSHFSDYAIVYEGDALSGETETIIPEEPIVENNLLIIPVIVVIITIVVMAVFFIARKNKNEEE